MKNGFIDVKEQLPDKTQEVQVLINGKICECVYYSDNSDLFPYGFFGTYYRMVINNVTHWR